MIMEPGGYHRRPSDYIGHLADIGDRRIELLNFFPFDAPQFTLKFPAFPFEGVPLGG